MSICSSRDAPALTVRAATRARDVRRGRSRPHEHSRARRGPRFGRGQPRRALAPPVGDGQHLQYRQASERDRNPRADAGSRLPDARCRCSSQVDYWTADRRFERAKNVRPVRLELGKKAQATGCGRAGSSSRSRRRRPARDGHVPVEARRPGARPRDARHRPRGQGRHVRGPAGLQHRHLRDQDPVTQTFSRISGGCAASGQRARRTAAGRS